MQTINKKRQTDEIRRCARDPVYFFNTYCKISHPIKGPINFNTFAFQDECVKAFVNNRFVIVNKSRQLGLSTLAAAYATWLLLFHRNKEVLVMATKLKTAMNFIRKVKFCVTNLPKWLVLPKIVDDNKQTLSFGSPSNSKIEAIPTSEDAGRSEALSLLIVDEAAHVANFEELWKGLYPTLSTGGRAIIISTPKGVGNWFHKLWADATEEKNDFHFIELPWDVHPERNTDWFENETKNMSQKAIAQELLCSFLASGETYIDPLDIEWVGANIKPPIRREGEGGNVWVWADPIYDKQVKYLISADVGRGDGTDYSAFHILCLTTGDVVAEFRGKLRPDIFAKLLFDYGERYNNALICPERNTFGHHVLTDLVRAGYTKIYSDKKNESVYATQGMLNPSELGFDTQRDSRKKIVSRLEEVIRNRQIRTYSSRLHNELKTFIVSGNKPQALRNCHDDLVMALAIGAWIFDASQSNSKWAIELQQIMLSSMKVTSHTLDQVPGSGNEALPSVTRYTQYGMTNSSGHRSRDALMNKGLDFGWLLK